MYPWLIPLINCGLGALQVKRTVVELTASACTFPGGTVGTDVDRRQRGKGEKDNDEEKKKKKKKERTARAGVQPHLSAVRFRFKVSVSFGEARMRQSERV